MNKVRAANVTENRKGFMAMLDEKQKTWIEETFASLSMEERVAQLLLPTCGSADVAAPLLESMKEIPIGGMFVWQGTVESHRAHIKNMQSASRIPMVIAADLECGAGHIVRGMTTFPDPLAVGAADDEELAYLMGKAAAVEGRAVGVHWTFAPIADVNVNPENPIANTRSLGDDPERVGQLAAAISRGLQDHGIAACPKHFPGDGVDDIDQHTATSINSLTMDEWRKISGRAFQLVFDAGAWSTMIGHIALPAYDGEVDRRGAYRPATVSKKLLTDLLRNELGFEGLIVTDDMNMGGVTGYYQKSKAVVESVKAGCDVVLFPTLPDDYHALVEAVKSGDLPEERVNDAAHRLLEFKAKLGLHEEALFGDDVTDDDKKSFVEASEKIATKALHLVRDVDNVLPVKTLKKGDRVLTVTLSADGVELDVLDEELKARGFKVDHLTNPVDMTFTENTRAYDAVFLNFGFKACWTVNSVRSVGIHNRIFFRSFYNEHPCAVMTSFGSPYHLRMFSTLPNYINAHSSSPESQRAAVAAWLGEAPINGHSPVSNLTRSF